MSSYIDHFGPRREALTDFNGLYCANWATHLTTFWMLLLFLLPLSFSLFQFSIFNFQSSQCEEEHNKNDERGVITCMYIKIIYRAASAPRRIYRNQIRRSSTNYHRSLSPSLPGSFTDTISTNKGPSR